MNKKNEYETSLVGFCEGGDPECDCEGYELCLVKTGYQNNLFECNIRENIVYNYESKYFKKDNSPKNMNEKQLYDLVIQKLEEEIKQYPDDDESWKETKNRILEDLKEKKSKL